MPLLAKLAMALAQPPLDDGHALSGVVAFLVAGRNHRRQASKKHRGETQEPKNPFRVEVVTKFIREGTMTDKFERVERNLYRRRYQTASGQSITRFYGIFMDHKGLRRRFPLG